MEKVKISVVIPVHNTKDYLKECVDSVLAQTYEKMEIILVDDGSTDGSGRLCEEYTARDSRIKVYHKNKSGVGGGRNTGLDHATGEFISFVDSDDTVAPDYLERMVRAQQSIGADIVCTGYCRVWETEGKIEEIGFQAASYEGGAEILLALGRGRVEEVAWAKLYRAEIFKDLRFPENRIHEDVFTTHLAFCYAQKIVQLSDCKYYYLQRPGSVMHGETTAEKQFEAYVKRYEDICRIVQENHLPEEVSKTFFKRVSELCYQYAYQEFWKVQGDSVRNLRRYWRTHRREIHSLGIGFRRKTYFPYTIAVLSRLRQDKRRFIREEGAKACEKEK